MIDVNGSTGSIMAGKSVDSPMGVAGYEEGESDRPHDGRISALEKENALLRALADDKKRSTMIAQRQHLSKSLSKELSKEESAGSFNPDDITGEVDERLKRAIRRMPTGRRSIAAGKRDLGVSSDKLFGSSLRMDSMVWGRPSSKSNINTVETMNSSASIFGASTSSLFHSSFAKLDPQLHVGSAASVLKIVSPRCEPEQQPQAPAGVMGVFTKTVSTAMALREKPRFGEDGSGDVEKIAFHQFLEITLGNENVSDDRVADEVFTQRGHLFLDPFLASAVETCDCYPAHDPKDFRSFDPAAVAPFCFPDGVSVRTIPRIATEGAKRLGWIGSETDKYQILVFTDGHGNTSYGISISTHELVDRPELAHRVSDLRSRRRAARVLSRWWTKQTARIEAGMSDDDQSTSTFRSNFSQRTANTVASSMRGMGLLRNSFSFAAKDKRRISSTSSSDLVMGPGGRSLSAIEPMRPLEHHRNRRGSSVDSKASQGSRSNRRKSKPHGHIFEILDSFLLSSSIPEYDKTTDDGIWTQAKLRYRKSRMYYELVLRHRPLASAVDTDIGLGYDFNPFFDEECDRLGRMLNEQTLKAPDTAEDEVDCPLAKLRFEEDVDGFSKAKITREIRLKRKPKTDPRATEAYEYMVAVEEEGELCVVEKSYVFLSVRQEELVLMITALQRLVDSERVVSCIPCEVGHSLASEKGRGTGAGSFLNRALEKISVASTSSRVEGGGLEGIIKTRHDRLQLIRDEAKLSRTQERIEVKSELDFLFGEKPDVFKMKLPFEGVGAAEFSLPLPQVVGDWGLAKLLTTVGARAVMQVLKLLLLERSLLVVGSESEEVTCCACTLLELVRPFEWPNTFLPVLPESMLDLVNSPVPLVLGLTAKGTDQAKALVEDPRVKEAIEDGMSVVNLCSGDVLNVLEEEETQLVAIPEDLVEKLTCLEERVQLLAKQEPSLSGSIKSFVHSPRTRKESLTMNSIREAISDYIINLVGSPVKKGDDWRHYGRYNEQTDGFDYDPAMYCDRLCSELTFKKELAHTQMFAGLIHEKRNESLERERNRRGAAGAVIANWIWDHRGKILGGLRGPSSPRTPSGNGRKIGILF